MEKPEFVYREGAESKSDYVEWIGSVKQRFQKAQTKAVLQVNTAMLDFYWSIGRDLVALHPEEKWGKGIVRQFALDMRTSFPHETGFSETNVKCMKRWYDFYYQRVIIGHQLGAQFENIISQQAGTQMEMPELFGKIPWKHHVLIITKTKNLNEALFYINKTIEGNWSRSILESQMRNNLFAAQGAALTNFNNTLPMPQGKLAQEILKDPYNFEFLAMKAGYDEKELEDALISNITKFLLELGKGFAFVGRQMELQMPNGKSYFPDLIFYHIKLKSYVVIELKAVEFAPEFAGKINFYVSAADELLKADDDNPTIGLIICRASDKTIVEWSFRGVDRPIGVASYQIQDVVERTVKEIKDKQQI
ncbi:MAG: PDDEXK nuclease domain-containing protein [Bacteroidales bacterium]|nr:PDDEXK nuclease domain-containing protein [Bacteroidales bacterium]